MNGGISKSIKGFNIKLYLILILMLLIPTAYKTLRIHYLGDVPNDNGFNVASQITWLNVIFEVSQESLLLPLFFLLGNSVSNLKLLDNKIKTGIITTLFIHLFLVLFIFFGVDYLLILLAQKESILEISSKYIKLESIAILLSVVYRFTMIVLILLNKVKEIFLLLILQTMLTCACDFLFISQFSVSLKLGVLGIAYGNILVSCLLIFISLYMLKKEKVIIFRKSKLDFSWLKEWFKIGGFSGLESLIRNTIFFIVILRWVNMVEGQSYFWVSNTFLWSWLLVPVIALGELIKKEIGESNPKVKEVVKSAFVITSVIITLWLVSIPFWGFFFKHLMNINNPEIVIQISIIALIFYIVFAYNNIIDSVFYGLGRTDLMLIQSIIVNFIYYGIIYILVITDNIEISLNKIVLIFGFGILLDSIITFGIYKYTLTRNKLIKNTLHNRVG